jgi:hypothetical protein
MLHLHHETWFDDPGIAVGDGILIPYLGTPVAVLLATASKEIGGALSPTSPP